MSKEKQVTMKFDGDEKVIVYPNGRKVKRILKEHEVDKGERGIYNNRNQLNDLTGKEWTFLSTQSMKQIFLRTRKSSNYGDISKIQLLKLNIALMEMRLTVII